METSRGNVSNEEKPKSTANSSRSEQHSVKQAPRSTRRRHLPYSVTDAQSQTRTFNNIPIVVVNASGFMEHNAVCIPECVPFSTMSSDSLVAWAGRFEFPAFVTRLSAKQYGRDIKLLTPEKFTCTNPNVDKEVVFKMTAEWHDHSTLWEKLPNARQDRLGAVQNVCHHPGQHEQRGRPDHHRDVPRGATSDLSWAIRNYFAMTPEIVLVPELRAGLVGLYQKCADGDHLARRLSCT